MSDWQTPLSAASDEQIRNALRHAHIPALMAALMHLTGNRDHFAKVRPQFVMFAEDEDGLIEGDRELARELALAALLNYRDQGCGKLAAPGPDDIIAAMNYITGEDIPSQELPFLREELNLFAEDGRQVAIDTSSLNEDFQVIIIGTGMSGILMAIRLQQAGIPFIMLEKNPEMSGTWYENTYPGCQVDSANHLYNYLIEQNTQWPNHYSGRRELFKYFSGIVQKYALFEHVRLNCLVKRAAWHDNEWSKDCTHPIWGK